MNDKEELRREIVDLEWRALPFFEKWAYPKEVWLHRKYNLKKRLRAEKWQSMHVKNLGLILMALSIVGFVHPGLKWQVALLFLIASGSMFATEVLLKRRLHCIKQALHLKKKLKKCR